MVTPKPLTVKIPENTKVTIEGNLITVEGPKGRISQEIAQGIGVKQRDSEIIVERFEDSKKMRSLCGLIRALIANAILGVHEGFTKTLELSGVGFRAQVAGDTLTLSVGFSHPVTMKAPVGITFGVLENKITVSGIDKQLVGLVAHRVRSVRPPEPYKGKGIKYEGERIRRKAGKAAAKTVGGGK